MKKLAALVCTALVCAGALSASGGRIILNMYGNYLDMAKNDFTGQEGQGKVFFEAKAAVAVSGNLYLWASHGYLPMRDGWDGWDSKGSFNPDIRVERALGKRMIAGGCGFFVGYFEPRQIGVRVEAGICSVHHAIAATVREIGTSQFIRDEKSSQAAIGLRGSLSVTFGLVKSLFAEASAGYAYAPDKVDDVRSNLGGLHLALGVGIRL
ncbi:MAG: hypothetical protein JXO51_11815 [Candidatus Aminicenantes bacterium]|nr:hypothetical protein [Candidatus Aminicenantes bacterium]